MAWLLTLARHCSFFVSSTSVWDSLTEAIPLRYNELKGVRQATHIVMESTTCSLFFIIYNLSLVRILSRSLLPVDFLVHSTAPSSLRLSETFPLLFTIDFSSLARKDWCAFVYFQVQKSLYRLFDTRKQKGRREMQQCYNTSKECFALVP